MWLSGGIDEDLDRNDGRSKDFGDHEIVQRSQAAGRVLRRNDDAFDHVVPFASSEILRGALPVRLHHPRPIQRIQPAMASLQQPLVVERANRLARVEIHGDEVNSSLAYSRQPGRAEACTVGSERRSNFRLAQPKGVPSTNSSST